MCTRNARRRHASLLKTLWRPPRQRSTHSTSHSTPAASPVRPQRYVVRSCPSPPVAPLRAIPPLRGGTFRLLKGGGVLIRHQSTRAQTDSWLQPVRQKPRRWASHQASQLANATISRRAGQPPARPGSGPFPNPSHCSFRDQTCCRPAANRNAGSCKTTLHEKNGNKRNSRRMEQFRIGRTYYVESGGIHT